MLLPYNKHSPGEQRVVTRFLFWPLTLGTKRRWLELVKIRQELQLTYELVGFAEVVEWVNIRFEK